MLAMLYVGRWRRALGYLTVFLLMFAAYLGGGFAGLPVFTLDFSFTVGCVVITLLGMGDAWRIARGQRERFDGGWYSCWPFLLGLPLVLITVTFLTFTYLVGPFRIPATSMEPTLLRGDFLLAWKWPYRNYGTYGIPITSDLQPDPAALPARGDIVLFRFTGDPGIVYIKRVIGLPGDRVVIDRGVLTVNAQAASRRPTGKHLHDVEIHEETLDGRRYHVLGGSAQRGVSVSMTVPPGHYFVLGDNRNASNDSRHWGFLPQTHLVGRPLWIWWSVGEDGRVRRDRLGMPVR
ncbi:MAG: signal peptidase I [Pseudomonadota bacterium]